MMSQLLINLSRVISNVIQFSSVIYILVSFGSQFGFTKEFNKEDEKDFLIRSIGKLQVTNARGDITIQGWALDKVRVKAKKTILAEVPEEAKKLLELINYRYQISDGNIEITTEYGKGLGLQDRLKALDLSKVRIDLQIFAPSGLRLKAWTIEGKVLLKGWNGRAEIRTNSGNIKIEGVKSDQLSLLCSSCSTQLRNVHSSIQCMGGNGIVDFANVKGESIYVETQSGRQKMYRIEGKQLYLTQKGRIEGQILSGRIEFRVRQGSVDLLEIAGFLSGGIESGDVRAQVREWAFIDKAFIEATKGNIYLTLPRRFSGNVDLWSLEGKVQSDFSIKKATDLGTFGPEPPSHIVGRINKGGEMLKIYTEAGNIEVLKGDL